MKPIDYDVIVLRESADFVAYCPELDISSCGRDVEQARTHLRTAVRLFLEECEKLGTLDEVLLESGYQQTANGDWISPRIVATEIVSHEPCPA